MLGSSKEEVSLLSNVWAGRQFGIDLLQDTNSINPTTIKYICNYFYPFLQLVNPEANETEGFSLNIKTAISGATIIDYNVAMSISLSNNITANQKTSTERQIATVSEIANLIATKWWNVVELIAGTDLMKKLLWVESQRYDFALRGYEPTEESKRFLTRLKGFVKASSLPWEKTVETTNRNKVALAMSQE